MESKEITIGKPIMIAGATIVPLITTSARCYRLNGSLSIFGSKQPIYIVLVNKITQKAFRTTGEEVPLEQLAEEIPSLRHMLDSARQKGN
jgi:hypothetical protein